MAGAGVLFELHDKDLQELIARVGHSIDDLTPVMKSFGEYMERRTDDRFRAEKAPDGSPWQALSPVTLAAKARMKGGVDKILQQRGLLRLIHYEPDNKSLTLSSDRKYAAIHQYGGQAGRGRKVTIPKREFLGFNDEDVREFIETAKEWIVMGRKP